jgi:PTH1 family peptidyl-tRNA hydrolase
MKVIVGLGNPGKKYEGTRHNIGFDLLAELNRRWKVPRPREKFEALLAEVPVGSEKVVLLAPQTFMNLSGQSVRQVRDFYHLQPADFLVICDDLNLPVGRLRLRPGGSSGGQKGIQNIIQHLGTEEFPRLRIGVGRPPGDRNAADYVLDHFHKSELPLVDQAILLAADCCDCWLAEGVAAAMNRFNAEPPKGTSPSPDTPPR